jgi:hypothetical protein
LFVSRKKGSAIHQVQVKEKPMKDLKKLIAAVALTFVLGAAAFAGETNTPPCAPPVPGETNTPPCSGGQTLGDNSGIVSTPPASDSGYLVAEAAITLFESLLPLY